MKKKIIRVFAFLFVLGASSLGQAGAIHRFESIGSVLCERGELDRECERRACEEALDIAWGRCPGAIKGMTRDAWGFADYFPNNFLSVTKYCRLSIRCLRKT